jgi:hypothetical protein
MFLVPFIVVGVLGKLKESELHHKPFPNAFTAAQYGFGKNIWEIPPDRLVLALKVIFPQETCLLGADKSLYSFSSGTK